MKKVFHIFLIFLMLAVTMPLTYGQQQDSVRNLGEESAQNLSQEVLKNMKGIAKGSCNLFQVGVQVWDSLGYDEHVAWTPLTSIMELTLFFRNQSWRNLVWGLDDEIARYQNSLRKIQKEQCLLEFALAGARSLGKEEEKALVEKIVFKNEEKIRELKATIDLFKLERHQLLFTTEAKFGYLAPVDKIFYFLNDSVVRVSVEQFAKETKNVVMRFGSDLAVLGDQIPELCYSLINVPAELQKRFLFFNVEKQWKYKTFREYLEQEVKKKPDDYFGVCKKADKRKILPREITSQQEQYEAFQRGIDELIRAYEKDLDRVEKRLGEISQKLLFEKKKLSDQDKKKLRDEREILLQQRSQAIASIRYHHFVLSTVENPESASLTALSNSITSFVESVLGVKKDQKGNVSSRLKFADRFEKRKEKRLKEICSRLEAMYRKSGRDTGLLPSIGTANGKVYCQAEFTCEDITNQNVPGLSSGSKKMAECSVLGFEAKDLVPQTNFKQIGEDIGFLLEQAAYSDLLKSRDLYFASSYDRYRKLFSTQGNVTNVLFTPLTNVKTNLNPLDSRAYDGKNTTIPSNYSNLLKGTYRDLYTFLSKNKEQCDAPKTLD